MMTVADLGGLGRLAYGAVLLSAMSVGWAYVQYLRSAMRRQFKH